jgi:hypothetical protein
LALSFVWQWSSLLPLAGEGGRRPDEGGFIKNNTKNLTNTEKVINFLRNRKFQVEKIIDFVCEKSFIIMDDSQQLEQMKYDKNTPNDTTYKSKV